MTISRAEQGDIIRGRLDTVKAKYPLTEEELFRLLEATAAILLEGGYTRQETFLQPKLGPTNQRLIDRGLVNIVEGFVFVTAEGMATAMAHCNGAVDVAEKINQIGRQCNLHSRVACPCFILRAAMGDPRVACENFMPDAGWPEPNPKKGVTY